MCLNADELVQKTEEWREQLDEGEYKMNKR